MLEIKFTLSESTTRSTLYYLRQRYKSKAGLNALARLAVLTEAARQAKKELELEELE